MHAEIGQAAADYALVLIARHISARVQLGRPILALPDPEYDAIRVKTSTGWWWVYNDEREVDRLHQIDDEEYELTTFRNGSEVSRIIQRISDEDIEAVG
jgi:hypothetical protein